MRNENKLLYASLILLGFKLVSNNTLIIWAHINGIKLTIYPDSKGAYINDTLKLRYIHKKDLLTTINKILENISC